MRTAHDTGGNRLPSEYMSLDEVLDMLGISRSALYRWIKSGRAPKPRKFGPRTSLWLRRAIEALAQENSGMRAVKLRTNHEQRTSFEPIFDPAPEARRSVPARRLAGTMATAGETVFRFSERFYQLRRAQEVSHTPIGQPSARSKIVCPVEARRGGDVLHFPSKPVRYRTLSLRPASDTTAPENTVFRFSSAYPRVIAKLTEDMRPLRCAEAANLVGVTPAEFLRGVAEGRYPLPFKLRDRVFRWSFAEIRRLSGLRVADLDHRLTKDQVEVRRRKRASVKNARLKRVIENGSDEHGRRALADRISCILDQQFTSGGMTLITVYLPRFVLCRDELGTLDVAAVLACVRQLLRKIGLGTVKAIGALDIVQIAHVGWHNNPKPTWHPHLHIVIDTQNITSAMKRAAIQILSKQGTGNRLFHCKSVTREPFNTSYLLKSTDVMKRLKSKGQPLGEDRLPLEGRNRDALLDLLGRVSVRDWVYDQNVDLPSDLASGRSSKSVIRV